MTPTERNSLVPSITVSRAWAEVTNATLGQIRFGRMPWHWGLGILANAGNGIDSDYQTHVDRVMYQLRYRPLSLFAAAMYDFASTGLTSASYRYETGQGQPIDISAPSTTCTSTASPWAAASTPPRPASPSRAATSCGTGASTATTAARR